MKSLSFSSNWNNKLDCKAFSTIRIANPAKFKTGETYSISLNRQFIGHAKLVSINKFKLQDMSEPMAYLDTGYSKAETIEIIKKMFPKVKNDSHFMFLVFVWLDKP